MNDVLVPLSNNEHVNKYTTGKDSLDRIPLSAQLFRTTSQPQVNKSYPARKTAPFSTQLVNRNM